MAKRAYSVNGKIVGGKAFGQGLINEAYKNQPQNNPLANPANLPSTGPPAAAPTPAPQPYDAGLAAYTLSAGRNVALGNNEATWQTQNAAYDLGYDQNGQFNAANPYAQAQALQDQYKRSVLGTTNSMAAQGQLYAGSNLNAQATNDRNYSQADAALRQQAQQRYHTIGFNQAQTYANNAAGVADAGFNSLLKPYGS